MNGPKGIAELQWLDAVGLKKPGADILQREGPSTLAAGHLLMTGEVGRETSFEKGIPGMEMFTDGAWVPDPIRDDPAGIVIHVKDKGLVVVSGCALAGIENTVGSMRRRNHRHRACPCGPRRVPPGRARRSQKWSRRPSMR